MKNFGMVGMNPGNGHPFSFTACFNGFDPEALETRCSFPIIRKYLNEHHGNREFIPDARITHIWTHDPKLSADVAAVSKIPNIASSLEELANEVDGIIFARDDIWNHDEMALPLFKSGKPVYMDKLMCATPEELARWSKTIPADYPLMTASSFRFAPLVSQAAQMIKDNPPLTIRGMSPCVWLRYAPHLLDALFAICGREVETVQNSGSDGKDIVTLTYRDGLQVVLEVFDGVGLPLGLTLHFPAPQGPVEVPYTDSDLSSYFFSIVNMMKEFTGMAETGITPTPRDQMFHMNRVVLAGIASREQGGIKIKMDSFYPESK